MEAVGSLFHPLFELRIHAAAVVHNARNGTYGDTCLQSDISERCFVIRPRLVRHHQYPTPNPKIHEICVGS